MGLNYTPSIKIGLAQPPHCSTKAPTFDVSAEPEKKRRLSHTTRRLLPCDRHWSKAPKVFTSHHFCRLTAKVSRRLPHTAEPDFTTTADAAGGRLERLVGRSRCAEKNTDSQSSLTV